MSVTFDDQVSSVTIEVTEESVVEVEVTTNSLTVDLNGEITVEHTQNTVEIQDHRSEIVIENPRSQIVIGGDGGSSSANTFDELLDTPNSKAGHALKAVVVSADETELEFATIPGGTTYAYDDLSDTPASMVGQAGKGVAVNSGETAHEYVDYVLDTAYQIHLAATNPHSVTAAQAGADPTGSASAVQTALDAHEADLANPHAVTAVQAGADPVGSADAVGVLLKAHLSDEANPHVVNAGDIFPLDNDEYVTGKTPGGTESDLIGVDDSNNVAIGTIGLDAQIRGKGFHPEYWDGATVNEVCFVSELDSHAGDVTNPHATSIRDLSDTQDTTYVDGDLFRWNASLARFDPDVIKPSDLAMNISNYTASSYIGSVYHRIIRFDVSGGSTTTVVPTAVGHDGEILVYKKVEDSSNYLELTFTSGQQADGQDSITLIFRTSITLISNGTDWDII